MSDVILKKIELSRTCRTNEHYFGWFQTFFPKNKKSQKMAIFHIFLFFRDKSLQSTFTLNCALIGALNKYDHESWLWVIDLAAAAFVFHFYLKGIWSRRIFSILKWSQLKLFLLIINEEIFWFVSFFRIFIGWWNAT